jgi:hypothetical protein
LHRFGEFLLDVRVGVADGCIDALSAQQAKPTQATMRRVQHFLDYAATKEPAVTTYRASDMVLAIHSDTGYLNEEGARSRAGGHHFLSENVASPSNNGLRPLGTT